MVGSGRYAEPIPVKSPLGILQNMVNPSLAPTQPEGSELSTFSYGDEDIPRVLKQYLFLRMDIFSQYGEVINSLAWITSDSGNGLVSPLCQAIAWTNFDW